MSDAAGAEAIVSAQKLSVAEGIIIIVSNIVVAIVFLSKKQIREKYQMLITLAVADIINGYQSLGSGINVLHAYSQWPNLPGNELVKDCFPFIAPWTLAELLGWQWHSTIMLAVGIERFLAVFQPVYYRKSFSPFRRFLFALVSLISVICITIGMYIYAYFFRYDSPTYYFVCYAGGLLGTIGYDVLWGVIIVSDTTGFLLSLCAFVSARKKSRVAGEIGDHMKSELRRVYLFLVISGLSVLLVALPGLAFALSNHGIFSLNNSTGYYLGHAFKINYGLGFFIYLLLNGDFRSQFAYMTCIYRPNRVISLGLGPRPGPSGTENGRRGRGR